MALSTLNTESGAATASQLGITPPGGFVNLPPPGSGNMPLAAPTAAGLGALALAIFTPKPQAKNLPNTPENDWGGDSGSNDLANTPDPSTAIPGLRYRVYFTISYSWFWPDGSGGSGNPYTKSSYKDVYAPFTAPKLKVTTNASGGTTAQVSIIHANGEALYNLVTSGGSITVKQHFLTWSATPLYHDTPLDNYPDNPPYSPLPKPPPYNAYLLPPLNKQGDEPTSPTQQNAPNPTPTNGADPLANPNPTDSPNPNPTDNPIGNPVNNPSNNPFSSGSGSPIGSPTQSGIPSVPVWALPALGAPAITNGTNPNAPPQSSPNPVQTTPVPCNPANGCGAAMESTVNNNNQQISQINNQLQAVDLGLLAIINNKLGPLIGNGGLGGATGRLFNLLKVDRFLNIFNTVLILHNAVMLSRNLGETLGSTVDTVMQAAGFQFQDAEGNQQDFTEVVSGTVLNWAISIFGEEDVRMSILAWKKANRMYQAASNVVNSMRDIMESQRAMLEITGERISMVGNALREASVVLDDAYEQFETEFRGVNRFSRAFDNFKNGIEDVEESLEAIESVAQEVINIQDAFKEIKENQEEFKQAQQDLKDIVNEEYDAKKAESEVPAEITEFAFAKRDD